MILLFGVFGQAPYVLILVCRVGESEYGDILPCIELITSSNGFSHERYDLCLALNSTIKI